MKQHVCRLTWYEVDEHNIVTVAESTDGTIEQLLPIIHMLNGTDARWRLTALPELADE